VVISRIGQGGEFEPNGTDIIQQIAAINLGFDLGLTFIDTAEIYGDGFSEEMIGKAIDKKRSEVFVASKFSPENAAYKDVVNSAERTLKRLKTDYIDLYQVHWPNPKIPISETMSAMEQLVTDGKILNIGVSNFSKLELIKAQDALLKNKIFSNQVEYNLFDRFIEQEILPYCQKNDVKVIAYSPLFRGKTFDGDKSKNLLRTLSSKYSASFAQIALSWLVSKNLVYAIPKTTKQVHVRENALALNLKIDVEDIIKIDQTCASSPMFVSTDDIRVILNGERNSNAYQTLDEAIENKLNLSPSPLELASFLKLGEPTKPVRLIPNRDASSKYKYDLVEGRLRYWAWVIAFESLRPIPSYVRYD
jgi:diketogulonate reductase-like aldo/keto reductase